MFPESPGQVFKICPLNKERRSGQPKTDPLGWKYSIRRCGTGTGFDGRCPWLWYSERPEGYLRYRNRLSQLHSLHVLHSTRRVIPMYYKITLHTAVHT